MQHKEIERELVGAFFRDVASAGRELRESLADALDYLTPGDFSDEIAGELFGIVRALYKERGELPTLTAITDRANSNPNLKALNYHAIIAEWMEAGAASSVSVDADRETVKKASDIRAVVYEMTKGLDALKNPGCNPYAVFQSVVHAVEMEQDKGRETVIKSSTQLWFEYLEQVEKEGTLVRVPTGLETLDKELGGGYRAGTLNVIAARPGDGKSALMLQQARAAARAGFSPLIFSLEMDGCEMIERFYRQTIGGDPQFFVSERTAEINQCLNEEFFELIDAPMDMYEIEASCLRYHRKHPKSVFYIDYLGLIAKTKEQGNLSAVDFLDENTKRLKIIAKRTGATIVLLAQLNRDSTKTDEPQMSQLRGSGGIEQNADTVSLLWNPDEEKNTLRELKLAKNRQGRRGKIVDLDFYGERTLFIEARNPVEDTHKKTKKKKGTPPAPATPPQPGEDNTDYSYLNTGGFEFER